MPGIIILGLGPGDPKYLTLEAQQVLNEAHEVYLRTERHPMVSHLPEHLALHSFDSVYEARESFDEVYEEIVRRVTELGKRPEGVCYAVPGHPLVGESTVQRLLEAAAQEGLSVRIVAGLSFLEPTLQALGLDLLEGVQVLDATEVALMHHPPVNPDRPVLLGQLYSRAVASDVKLTLMNLYPDDHAVTLVTAAGLPAEELITVPLYEMDRQAGIGHLTTLYVPPLSREGSVEAYLEVVAHLRSEDGCPWDREQTHRSLRDTLLEETYEVLQALESDDVNALREELGDLMLQVLLQTQIAVDAGEFKLPDVISVIIAKLKRRHPHVFGGVEVSGAAEVVRNWEEIKAKEREGQPAKSLLSGVPLVLPSLAQAQALQARAARVGFDWEQIKGVVAKVTEEARELMLSPEERRADELGDLLFSIVNLARWLDVNAEAALRAANERFLRRFQEMERLAAERGETLSDLKLVEQEQLWEKTKRAGGA